MSRKTAADSLPIILLEALEPRIAPAVILAGPAEYGGQDYDDPGTPFKAASAAPVAGPSLNFDADHYYLDLKSGDTLKVYNAGSSFTDFVKVTGGRAYAFFFDKNTDKIPTVDELTGLALSEGAKLSVAGTVDGDVLATLSSKTGIFSTDSLVSNKQSIGSLSIGGDVHGSIVAGGSLTGVTVGKVGFVKSGNASALPFDFGGTGSGALIGKGVIGVFDPGAKQAGGNLSTIRIGAADGIYAGNGGAGGAGGSITGLTVVADADGLMVAGGNGGAAISGTTAGGAGGKVSQVVFAGVVESPHLPPNYLISVRGGVGGDGLNVLGSTGGIGGDVANIWIGYEYNSAKKIVESPNFLKDEILVAGGNGGDGSNAGKGGNATTINLVSSPVEDGGDAEISILGGDAGDLFAAGKKAGIGGSVSTFKIKNFDDGANASDALVQAGDASGSNLLVPTAGSSAAGGSITNPVPKAGEVWLFGESFAFSGGDGSDTTAGGGAGGSITNLQFNSFGNIVMEDLSISAGVGGNATTGAGGAGGNVSGVFSPLAALNTFGVLAGAGGASLGDGTKGGIGGKGGNIGGVQVFDTDAGTRVDVTGTAGPGGAGFSGGGAGGGITGFSFFGEYASLVLSAGAGGNVLGAKGNGGAGGSIAEVAFNSENSTSPLTQNVALTGGTGGNGPTAGGMGGSITKSNVQTMGSVTMTGGTGGSAGDKGKIGAGGSLGSSNALQGIFGHSPNSISFLAGNAGGVLAGTPTTGAAGGSIQNAVASASGNITFDAGDGSIGGNGGDIAKIGFYGEAGVSDIPSGNILVNAGNGGAAIVPDKGVAGRGGNVTTATGYTSENPLATVQFAAGAGGVGGKGGAGGSFNGLTIYDGAAAFSVLAGHGGSGPVAGGIGGSVSNIHVVPDVNVCALAAGDGGDTTAGKAKGANGGSVSVVNVSGDIGIRSGKAYGFATDGSKMGGIFAGKAGVNSLAPLDTKLSGIAGNVTSVTATAISAIVAGRDASPQLVTKVDGVFLQGNTAPKVFPTGAFLNFPDANLVGGKAGGTTLAGADAFHFVGGGTFAPSGNSFSPWTLGATQPLDGLIAALTLTSNRNFVPLAFLSNTVTDPKLPPAYGLYVPTVATA